MPYDPSEHNQVPQLISNTANTLQQALADYQRRKQEREFNTSAFETLAKINPNAIDPEDLAKYPTMPLGAQSAMLTTYGSRINGDLANQRQMDITRLHSSLQGMLQQARLDSEKPLRDAETANYSAEADARASKANEDPNALAKAIPTGVPGVSYVPGAKQIVRDPTINGNAKVIASREAGLNKQLAPFGLTHDDLGLVDTNTPNVVKYVDAGGNPVTNEAAGAFPSAYFAVGDAAGKPFKIPLPKFQSFVNQKKVLDSLTPADAPAAPAPGGTSDAPVPAVGAGAQTPASIKAAVKSGAMTREDGIKQLQALGFQ